MRILLAGLFLVNPLVSNAQLEIHKIDFETPKTKSSDPQDLVILGEKVFVLINDAILTTDLSLTNWEKKSIYLKSENKAGSLSSLNDELFAIGLELNDDINEVYGFEPAILDPNALSRRGIKDIRPGNGGSVSNDFILPYNGHTYFLANDGTNGTKMWVTDGTKEGTIMLSDFGRGNQDLHNIRPIPFNDKILINVLSEELWISDGTTEGTMVLKDFGGYQSDFANTPNQYVIVGDKAYFSIGPYNEKQIWQTDGTAEGTSVLADFSGLALYRPVLAELNNELYFLYENYGDVKIAKMSLENGTATEIFSKYVGQFNYGGAGVTEFGEQLFFAVKGIDDLPSGIWRTDGTNEGTNLYQAIDGFQHAYTSLSSSFGFFFTIEDALRGTELWFSNGDENGIILLKDISPGPLGNGIRILGEVNGQVLFVANDGTSGTELWKTDGTPDNTTLVEDFTPEAFSIDLNSYDNANNDLYFNIDFNKFGWFNYPSLFELSSDYELLNILSTPNYILSNGSSIVSLDNTIYFGGAPQSGYDPSGNQLGKLYRYSNNELGIVKEFTEGGATNLRESNGTIFFTSYSPTIGSEYWISDKTESGTKLLKDINTDILFSTVHNYDVVFSNGYYYFPALDSQGKIDLWKTDLSEEGTLKVSDVYQSNGSSRFEKLVSIADKVFFTGSTNGVDFQIFLSDGSDLGTIPILDGIGNSYFAINGFIYILVSDSENSYPNFRLWKTDGTVEGSTVVRDFGNVFYRNYPPAIACNNGILFNELGDSDLKLFFINADEEISMVKEGLSFSFMESVQNGNETYYGDSYESLWVSDGSPEGTKEILNIAQEKSIHFPSNLVVHKRDLIFSAQKGLSVGLWALPILHPEYQVSENDAIVDPEEDGISFTATLRSPMSKTLTIKNIGYSSISFSGEPKVIISGADQADFSVVPDLPETLGINRSTIVTIAFTPSSSGEKHAILSIDLNDGSEVLELNLFGQGIKGTPTISFAELPAKSILDESFELTASVDSDQAISFASSNSEVVSVEGNSAVIHKIGAVTITASVVENDQYVAASKEQPLIVNGVAQTITFEPLPEKTYGDAPFDLTASVDTDQEISFSSSNPEIASIQGKTVTIHKAGTVTITASVAATELNNAASKQQSLTINGVEQTITFNPLPEKTYGDAPFELSATTSSGLDVTFSSSDAAVASVEGTTVTILKAGAVTITASQAGNDNYSSATATQTLTINKAAQAIAFATLPAKTFGDASFELSASTTSGLTVAYASNDATVAKVEGTTVALLKPGSATITASQSGNENYLAAASAEQSLVVNKAGQTITFEPLAAKTFGDPVFEFSATSSIGLPVVFSSSDPAVVSVEGNSASIVKAGAVTITASQAGNDNYNAASAEQTLTIAKASQTITFDELPTLRSDDDPIELVAEASSGLPVAFQSEDETIAAIDGATLTITGSGTTSITATQGGDENYLAAAEITRALVVEEVTGLKNGLAGLLEVFPNPVQELLFIKHNADLKGEFALTSISGEVISNGYLDKAGSTAIRTSNLKDGIYLLTISNDGTKITYRIIKGN